LFLELFQLLVGKILEIDELIARVFDCSNQFVQFQVNCFGVTILGVLNQKYHQECDNGGSCVDDQLPGIGEMKSGAVRSQTTMTSTAPANAHALPRNASLTIQRKSRFCSFFFSFPT